MTGAPSVPRDSQACHQHRTGAQCFLRATRGDQQGTRSMYNLNGSECLFGHSAKTRILPRVLMKNGSTDSAVTLGPYNKWGSECFLLHHCVKVCLGNSILQALIPGADGGMRARNSWEAWPSLRQLG